MRDEAPDSLLVCICKSFFFCHSLAEAGNSQILVNIIQYSVVKISSMVGLVAIVVISWLLLVTTFSLPLTQ